MPKDQTIYCQLNTEMDNIQQFLINAHFTLKEISFSVNVFMIPQNIGIENIETIDQLQDVIILQDSNGQKRQMIDVKHHQTTAIEQLISSKKLLEKLNYRELFHINEDRYHYIKDNIPLTLIHIQKLGIWVNSNHLLCFPKEYQDLASANLLDDQKLTENDLTNMAFHHFK